MDETKLSEETEEREEIRSTRHKGEQQGISRSNRHRLLSAGGCAWLLRMNILYY